MNPEVEILCNLIDDKLKALSIELKAIVKEAYSEGKEQDDKRRLKV